MRSLFLTCAIVLAVVMTARVHATVVLPAEFREVVAGSTIIAHVQIVEVRPEWADGRRRIDSLVSASVVSYLKGGNSGRTIAFKVPGGELGRYRSVTVGAPVFKPGDEAVLFLSSSDGAPLHVFGLNQGVFRVRPDPVSGRRMVVTPIVVASGEAPEKITRGSAVRRPLALEDFGAQVRAVLLQVQRGQQ
jgi:hypothetical protein